MGLEIVELVLRVEDEFDINLPDSDLEVLKTPADLAWYIHTKLCKQREEAKTPQRGFYILRKILMQEFGFKREQLRPSTKLQDLFKDDVRRNWKRLDKLFSYSLPSLALTPKEHIEVFILDSILPLYLLLSTGEWDIALFFFFILYPIILFVYKKFFATKIPKRCERLSSLLRYIDYSKRLNRYNDYGDILNRIIEISAEELGISQEKIKPNSRYVEDLGAW